MARKLPVILFVVVVLVASFNPGMELGFYSGALDVSTIPQVDTELVRAQQYGGSLPLYTPVPTPFVTPSPTPIPTPTPVPTPEPTPIVRGMSGPEVKTLQSQLVTLGFLYDEPDGVYGKGTEEAVTRLQEYMNLVEADKNPQPSASDSQDGATSLFDGGAALADDAKPTQAPTPAPYPVTGAVNGKLMQTLREGDFPLYRETGLMKDSQGTEVRRLQARLNSLKYVYKNVDSAFGKNTEEALKYFQERNGIISTGIADQETLNMLYSPMAKENDKQLHPYMAVVDVSDQRVYIYAWHNGKYDKKVKTFICSTGMSATPTPYGEYQENTGPMNRWHYFKDFNCWAQYSYSIEGNVLFHSVLYSKQDTRTLTSSSLYNLGSRASHGCVRLKVKDAKWIFEHLPAGTTVKVKR